MAFFRLHWHELLAYSVAALSICLGLLFSTKESPDLIGGAGSVIVVCGVLLATSRKLDVLQDKVTNFINTHKENNRNLISDELRKQLGKEPTADKVEEIRDAAYGDAHQETGEIFDRFRKIFKIHELILVIGGTLVNGFGPWLVKNWTCS